MRPSKASSLALFICLFLCFPGLCRAARISVSADEMSREDGVYVFSGNVVVEREGTTVRADWATYDERTSELRAKGNITSESSDLLIRADEAFLNLDEETGFIERAEVFVKKDNYYIRGRRLEKKGPDSFEIEQAVFTSCDSPVPAWSITSRKIELAVGEGLSARGASFLIKDVPVFYTPYAAAPVLVERKTGFLAPNLGFREFSGMHLEIPFFWNMAPNRDTTVALEVHTKRAVGGSVNFRYLERGGFSGGQSLLYLRDWRDERNYFELEGEHDYTPRDGSGAFLKIAAINHTDFLRLYNLRIEERASRFLESKGQAWAEVFDGGKAYLLARVFQDLREGENQGGVLQHAPELGLFAMPREAGPFVFQLQADAASFFREDGQWGRRVRVEPELTHAAGSGLTLFQSLGLSALAYDLSEPDDSSERVVLDYEAALRTRLRKTYGRTVHFLEPSVSFIHKSLSGDRPAVLFDSLEAEEDASVIEASVMNRFRGAEGDVLLLKVSEQYDLESGRPLGPVNLDVSSARPFALRGVVSVDPYDLDIEAVDIEARVDIMKDALLSARERYSRPEDSWVHTAAVSFRAARNVVVESGIWYDSEGGGLRDFRTSLNYLSQCWSMRFTFSKKPDDVAFYVQVELLGLGSPGG